MILSDESNQNQTISQNYERYHKAINEISEIVSGLHSGTN